MLVESGFGDVEERIFRNQLQMQSAKQTLTMMQESFGAYRAVVSDCSEEVKTAAWAEVAEEIKCFQTENGFNAPAEVMVACGTKIKRH